MKVQAACILLFFGASLASEPPKATPAKIEEQAQVLADEQCITRCKGFSEEKTLESCKTGCVLYNVGKSLSSSATDKLTKCKEDCISSKGGDESERTACKNGCEFAEAKNEPRIDIMPGFELPLTPFFTPFLPKTEVQVQREDSPFEGILDILKNKERKEEAKNDLNEDFGPVETNNFGPINSFIPQRIRTLIQTVLASMNQLSHSGRGKVVIIQSAPRGEAQNSLELLHDQFLNDNLDKPNPLDSDVALNSENNLFGVELFNERIHNPELSKPTTIYAYKCLKDTKDMSWSTYISCGLARIQLPRWAMACLLTVTLMSTILFCFSHKPKPKRPRIIAGIIPPPYTIKKTKDIESTLVLSSHSVDFPPSYDDVAKVDLPEDQEAGPLPEKLDMEKEPKI